jgi:hypothetical protein
VNNDELFFLCVLTGAEEIIGLDNPIVGLNEEEVENYWLEVSSALYDKKVIYRNEANEICINGEYSKIAASVAFPDVAFISSPEEAILKTIYVKGSIYLIMVKAKELETKIFENREEFLEYLNQEFMLISCNNEISMNIATYDFDESVKLYMTGDILQALDIFVKGDIDISEAQLALKEFVNNTESREFIGYRKNQEIPSEALFKTVKTQEGTWLFKIQNDQTHIFRCGIQKSLGELLNF